MGTDGNAGVGVSAPAMRHGGEATGDHAASNSYCPVISDAQVISPMGIVLGSEFFYTCHHRGERSSAQRDANTTSKSLAFP